MSALTADKGHICVFFFAYKHGEGWVLLIAVSSRVISLVQNNLVLFTKHKLQSCSSLALYFCQWKMRLRTEECQHHHVLSTCPLHAFQTLCTCSQRDEAAAFPWGNEWSFYVLSLTKALKRFCAQQIVSNSRENWSLRYFDAALLFTKKVQNSLSSKIIGIRQYSLSLHALSILLANTYPEAIFYSQGHSCRVHLVLPGLEGRLLLLELGAPCHPKHCPPPCIFQAYIFQLAETLNAPASPDLPFWLLLFQLPACVSEVGCFLCKRISSERQY